MKSQEQDAFKEKVRQRVEEKKAQHIASLLRRREREDIVCAGVCPDCTGDVHKVQPLRSLLTDTDRFQCSVCGRVHVIHRGE